MKKKKKNDEKKYSTSLSTIVLVVLTTANFGGGSVISAGTIHDLRWVKVPAHFETPGYKKKVHLNAINHLK